MNVKSIATVLKYTVIVYLLHSFSDGVGRSGTFCALVVSINRFKAEQMVDVFQTIITMRTQKPQLVTNAVREVVIQFECFIRKFSVL